MNFPTLSEPKRLEMLQPPTRQVRMVLDTDTYNEIDDQFAVVHALLSAERLTVEALYAAPFHNSRSEGPEDGMEQSYTEILRVLEILGVPAERLVYRGARSFLCHKKMPVSSDAAKDLVQRAFTATTEQPLYVVAVGAITNVASALLMEPEILKQIVVIWLGGNPLYWSHTREFNLMQDIHSAQVIFDCGVPLVHLPARGVVSHLHTTAAELERYVAGNGEIAEYLVKIFKEYSRDHFAWSKVIWDLSATAYLVNPEWVPTEIVHSPILTEALTWSFDKSRHFMRVATSVNRDPIFRDLFEKLRTHAA